MDGRATNSLSQTTTSFLSMSGIPSPGRSSSTQGAQHPFSSTSATGPFNAGSDSTSSTWYSLLCNYFKKNLSLIFELKTIVSIFTSVSFLSSFAASDLEQRPAEGLSASSTFSLSSSPWTKEKEGNICEKHFAADLTNLSAWLGLRRHFERRQVEAEIGFRKKEMFWLWNLEMLLLKAVGVDHRSALLTVPTVKHLVRLYKSAIRINWKLSSIGQVP